MDSKISDLEALDLIEKIWNAYCILMPTGKRVVARLATYLGFSPEESQEYEDQNSSDEIARNGSIGTVKMIQAFRQKKHADERQRMREALKRAELVGIELRVFKDDSVGANMKEGRHEEAGSASTSGSERTSKGKQPVKKAKQLKKKGKRTSREDDSVGANMKEGRHEEAGSASTSGSERTSKGKQPVKKAKQLKKKGKRTSREGSERTSKGKQPVKKAKQLKKKGKRTSREVSSEEEEEEDQPSVSDERHAMKRKSEGEMTTEPRRKKADKCHAMKRKSEGEMTTEPRKKKAKRTRDTFDEMEIESDSETEGDGTVKIYHMKRCNKGHALIIANEKFSEGRSRPWANEDVGNMQNLLKFLGYQLTKTYRDLPVNQKNREGMKQALQHFRKRLESDNPQSALVYISSHGSKTGIEGVEGEFLPIEYLLELFAGVLPRRPKILIIDACWGGGVTMTSSTSVPNSTSQPSGNLTIPENAGIFMIHSTSYGKVSWSNDEGGSWFLQDFCDVVEHNWQEDLDTMVLRVTKKMWRRTASYRGREWGTQSITLIKQGVHRRLFFFPEDGSQWTQWRKNKRS